jgi:hypothetical protein
MRCLKWCERLFRYRMKPEHIFVLNTSYFDSQKVQNKAKNFRDARLRFKTFDALR